MTPRAAAGFDGVVIRIDDGVARVLVEAERDEWFFPTSALPAGTERGDTIRFERLFGHVTAVGATGHADQRSVRSFAERLNGLRAARTQPAEPAVPSGPPV